MKLVCTSDIHGDLPDPTTMPSGDVLVLAGDLLPDDYKVPWYATGTSTRIERQGWWFKHVFIPWLAEVKHIIPEDKAGEWPRRYKKIIFTGGNHDFFLNAMLPSGIRRMLPNSVFYLDESSVEIDGKVFWGAGWNMTPGWAFAHTEDEFAEKLRYLPAKIDVMVVHGPPKHMLISGHYCSKTLTEHLIKRSDVKAFICGHIHEAYGTYQVGSIPIYVVSRKNRNYKDTNPFVEITI
jgi:Icc-related predicted phosphoesterase